MKICDRCGSKKEIRSDNPWFGGKDLCTKCFLEFRNAANKWFANKLKICRSEPKLVFEEVKEEKRPSDWCIHIKGGVKE